MVSSANTGFRKRLDCSRKPTSDSSTRYGNNPAPGAGMDQRLKAVREQVRHATGAAILDIVMHGVSVAARGLEGGEYGAGLGAARQHKALAKHEVLEPA